MFFRTIAKASVLRQRITISMTRGLKDWKGCSRPERKVLEGILVRLEPLDAKKHGDDLYEISSGEWAEERFKYLWETVETRENYQKWLEKMAKSEDPLMLAVINKATGKAEGRQSYCNIDEENGTIEINHVLRGPNLEGKPGSAEAFKLQCAYLFEELEYRRIWARVHHQNVRSQNMMKRYGLKFEGVLRQHGVKKGCNQDSHIYSLLDHEWPAVRQALKNWMITNKM